MSTAKFWAKGTPSSSSSSEPSDSDAENEAAQKPSAGAVTAPKRAAKGAAKKKAPVWVADSSDSENERRVIRRKNESESSSSESSSSESEGSESSEVAGKASSAKRRRSSLSSGTAGESDLDFSSSEEETSSTSSASEAGADAEDQGYDARHRRAMLKWGLKHGEDDGAAKKGQQKEAAKKREQDREVRAKAKKQGAGQQAAMAPVTTEQQRRASALFADPESITAESVLAKAKELAAVRTRRRPEKLEQIQSLQLLATLAAKRIKQPAVSLEIYALIAAGFLELGNTTAGGASLLQSIITNVMEVVQILLTNPEVRFTQQSSLAVIPFEEEVPEGAAAAGASAAPNGNKKDAAALPAASTTSSGVAESALPPKDSLVATELSITLTIVVSLVERADDAFIRALQISEVHGRDYREKLALTIDQQMLLWLAQCCLFKVIPETYKLETPPVEAYRASLRLLEHLYYIPDDFSTKKWDLVKRKLQASSAQKQYPDVVFEDLPSEKLKPSEMVDQLAQKVFGLSSPGDLRGPLQALLQKIYCKAIHDRYAEARDLFTTLNLQDLAWQLDVTHQILYNRCITQLGLAAFRAGNMVDALQFLSDICGGNRQRELLAQGVSSIKGYEKTIEQERLERRRLLPAHMHINLDMVECFYNIAAMLIEIPQMCAASAAPFDARNRLGNSRFRRLFEAFRRATTPPGNAREQVMCAARALQKGEWAACSEMIMSLKFWDFVANKDTIKQTLLDCIKEQSLRSYMLTYAKVYASVSLQQFSVMFQLPEYKVHEVLAAMILSGELPGLLEESTGCVIINKTEPTKLQSISCMIAEKTSVALDKTEALLPTKATGGMKFVCSGTAGQGTQQKEARQQYQGQASGGLQSRGGADRQNPL